MVMKKAFLVIVLIVSVLFSVVLFKTFRFTSKQIKVTPVTNDKINAQEVAEHLAGALRCPTVSHEEEGQLNTEAFLDLHKYLAQTFPKLHSQLSKEIVADYSLLYIWKGRDDKLKPILLMSHLDVVPIAPDSENQWSYPPFAGRIADGYIWGRGTLDDKVGVLGILEAVETLVSEKYQPQRTVYFAFGHDEERGGKQGAFNIAKLLGERGITFEFLLDEGGLITTGLIPGITAPVAFVAVAEKASVSVELTVETDGGHSSTPPKQSAIGVLSAAIKQLEDNPMPSRISGAIERSFAYLGPEMPFLPRIVLANLWMFDSPVRWQLAANPISDATIRTTTAVTIIAGGVKANVLPSKATAIVNFRVLPGDKVNDVLEHVRHTVADSRINIKLHGDNPREPSNISSDETESFRLLQQTISEVFPQIIVAPYLSVAATDTRDYERLSDNIYRFVPGRVKAGDLKSIHGTNERISVENYLEAVHFYRQVLRNSTIK
jgi:carboxypeptidase PM20D1